MNDDFLSRYFAAFDTIPGWCSPDAFLMFMAYHQLLADEGLAGDVLEIGVYHGLSAIGIAALRGEARGFVALDLFDEPQTENGSASGLGNRQPFTANMRRFYDDLSFLTTIAAPSAALRRVSRKRVFASVISMAVTPRPRRTPTRLCSAITCPGGLIAVDDYFNPSFPGVAEAAIRFGIEIQVRCDRSRSDPTRRSFSGAGSLRSQCPIRRRLLRTPEHVPLWEARSAVRHDVRRVPRYGSLDATTTTHPQASAPPRSSRAGGGLRHRRREGVDPGAGHESLQIPFAQGNGPFGLSYHLMTADRQLLRFDHPRRGSAIHSFQATPAT